jgi:hypothetical protein
MRQPLFSTIHGSHLYGLAGPDSDRDHYTVVTRLPHVIHNGTRARYAKQSIRGEDDNFTIDLSTFLLLCDKGVPQALEAMFSRQPTLDLIAGLRASYRVSTPVVPTYLRTIKSFLKAGDFKRKRHAVRLAFNAREILCSGRFDPTLSDSDRETVQRYAVEYDAEDLLEVLQEHVLRF